jgi:hypothetical protein
MPIRINLLAESQALEELRRRDPVKRAIRIAVLLGVLIFVWAGYLQTRIFNVKRESNHLETQLQARTNDYRQVIANRKKWEDANEKLDKLVQLTTNRFLNGTLLDALQHVTVDNVQLTRIRIEHNYQTVEETKTKKDSEGKVITRGKPGSATERVVLTLEGRDTSGGEQMIKYRDAIARSPYFQSMVGKTNEVRFAKSETQASDDKKTVHFTLECRFPEKVR